MGIFNIMNTSASGLTAERLRMDLIADNIANSQTTRTEKGEAYRRKMAVFGENKKDFIVPMNLTKDDVEKNYTGGVKVLKIAEDQTPFNYVYDPEHPDANEKGYVAMPNVNVVKEMVDMITATRAYEANATVITNAKSMAQAALQIGK
ncbi:MAG: flagellar basal body rod protein FlgC [Fusobacteriaceae bacterium]|jgi:flagellar basal-body rod protein FlgC|nr:flagellar basal body rod protein FlgC [Fusobacteriaceae bacterium]MBN2838625.1 flagellar basal body rod protein FlgC [Fusobacteriaceae bacterium]